SSKWCATSSSARRGGQAIPPGVQSDLPRRADRKVTWHLLGRHAHPSSKERPKRHLVNEPILDSSAKFYVLLLLAILPAISASCKVGPKYHVPVTPMTPNFKEPPPAGWKEAQPQDDCIRGNWWEMFGDAQLNALEEQVNISNQTIAAAEANFRAARATITV